jgi:ribosomal protein S18 acetylase RimI-like enzyme
MVRLEPMSEEEFQATLGKAIPRHAAARVRRGFWKEEESLEASRTDYAQMLPQGLETPHRHFCNLVDEESGARIGEAWYVLQSKGGKTQLWIDWIWVEPEFRRRGYATQVFGRLEEEARARGAGRVGLHVVSENEGALALYDKLGYAVTDLLMAKVVAPPT